MMGVIVRENPPITAFSVLCVELSVTTVSVGSLLACYEMSSTFTACEWFFCVQPLCGMYENIVNCDWLKEDSLSPLALIGSWCHSRMWSVPESERLLCIARLLFKQLVVQVLLLDLYSASVLLRTWWVRLGILWVWGYCCCCCAFPLVTPEVKTWFIFYNVWKHEAVQTWGTGIKDSSLFLTTSRKIRQIAVESRLNGNVIYYIWLCACFMLNSLLYQVYCTFIKLIK